MAKLHAERVLGSAEPQRSEQWKGCAEVLKSAARPRSDFAIRERRNLAAWWSRARAAPRLRVRVGEKLTTSEGTCGPLLLLKVSAQGFGALGGVSNQGDLAPPALVLHGHYGWRTHVG